MLAFMTVLFVLPLFSHLSNIPINRRLREGSTYILFALVSQVSAECSYTMSFVYFFSRYHTKHTMYTVDALSRRNSDSCSNGDSNCLDPGLRNDRWMHWRIHNITYLVYQRRNLHNFSSPLGTSGSKLRDSFSDVDGGGRGNDHSTSSIRCKLHPLKCLTFFKEVFVNDQADIIADVWTNE